MKRFIVAGLSVVALSIAATSSAQAANQTETNSWRDRVSATRTHHNSAFNNGSSDRSVMQVSQATSELSNQPSDNVSRNNSNPWSDRVSTTRTKHNSGFNNASKNRSATQTAQAPQATPFDLVFLARKGYFQEQGIPSYGSFHTSVRTGRISAEDIVKAAIADNKVSPEVLNDRGYMNAIERKLARLSRN